MADLRSRVETFYDRFNAGDLDGAIAVFHDDVTTIEPGLGHATTAAEWRAYGEIYRRACPDARLVIRNCIEEGDRVAVEGTFTGTFTDTLDSPQGPVPPTGRAFSVDFGDFFHFRGDRVAEHRVYYDQVDFMNQLGLTPPPQ